MLKKGKGKYNLKKEEEYTTPRTKLPDDIKGETVFLLLIHYIEENYPF